MVTKETFLLNYIAIDPMVSEKNIFNFFFFWLLRILQGLQIFKQCSVSTNQGYFPLRKNVYSNIQKNSPPKTENFQIKISIVHISAQNIDCGYSLELPWQGGSN